MLYLFLCAHLIADFVLQPYWLVMRKRHLDGLLIHCGIVLLCMLALPLLDYATSALIPAMLIITLVHFAADWWKVHYGHVIPGPPIVPFLLDQIIHLTTIVVVLSAMLTPGSMWGVQASPYGLFALYGAAYVVAAFATPIGAMIWLDPNAANAALSGGARLRSVLAGISVVSITVFGGLVAFPATLMGMVVLARHPQSNHPLDMPAGMLTVLAVGASMGTLLALMG